MGNIKREKERPKLMASPHSVADLRRAFCDPATPRAERNRIAFELAHLETKATVRALKLRNVIGSISVTTGERHNARVALAALLADWPDLETGRPEVEIDPPPASESRRTAEARRARTRQSVPQGPALPTQEELREIIAGELRGFLDHFGSQVEARLPPELVDWFGENGPE
jgi:hypothetical protein